VSGTQCRSGRSGEGNTLSSPYQNRTTPPLLLSLWSSHYIDRARGAREQFGRRYSHACSQLAYWWPCVLLQERSVLFKNANRPQLTCHTPPKRKMRLQDN
jgi:hypothetical protein